jgi:hypothetical protein
MYRFIILLIFVSCLSANTVIRLKDGTTIENDVIKVNRAFMQLANQQGVMIKLIASIQTSDSALVQNIIQVYPHVPVEKVSENRYRLDFSNLEIAVVDDSENDKRKLVRSYAFNLMLNTQRRHLFELNASILTRYGWCGEIGYTHGSDSYPDFITAYDQTLQVDISTESFGIGFGKMFDMHIGRLLTDVNLWLSSSNANIPVTYRIPEEGDSLLIMTNANELVIAPGVTFLKIDSSRLLQVMVGIRYFFDGIMLGDRGWYIEERFYPYDKQFRKRGLSLHLGIGINLPVK